MTNRIKESISLRFYQKNEMVKEKYLSMVKDWVKKQPIKSLIYKMNKKVKQLLENYEEDFYVHDIQSIIYSGANRKMIWIVRKNGTHIVDLNSLRFSSKGEWSARSYFDAIVGMSGKRTYFYIDNEKLIEINEEACFEHLNDYEKVNREKLETGETEEERVLANRKYNEKFDYNGRRVKRPKKRKNKSALNQMENTTTLSSEVTEFKTYEKKHVEPSDFVYEIDEEGQLIWVG